MEILRSTDGLHAQILDEARRLAAERLAEADRQIAQLRQESQDRIGRERERLAAQHEALQRRLSQEAQALLPLELRRLRLRWEADHLTAALEAWAAALPAEVLMALLEPRLRRALPVLVGRTVRVVLSGLGRDAEIWVRSVLSGTTDDGHPVNEEPPTDPLIRGVSVESLDQRLRFRVSARELVDELLEEHSTALRDALFPEGGSS